MKRVLIAGLLTLASFGLVACDTDTPATSTDATDSSSSSSSSSSSTEEEEDYTIVTSDNGLTIDGDSYMVAAAEEGDTDAPDFELSIVADNNTWGLTSSVNDDYTKLISEDESVIPSSALSFEIEKRAGTNIISGFTISVDRTLISPGTTRVKFEVYPSGGNTSMMKLTTICVEIQVVEFGSIEVDTYNVNFTLDVYDLSTIISDNGITAESIYWYFRDSADESEVYGYSADYMTSVSIDPADLGSVPSYTMEGVKVAADHTYMTWIYVQDANSSFTRLWIPVTPGSGEGYTIASPVNGMSDVTVTADTTISAALYADGVFSTGN